MLPADLDRITAGGTHQGIAAEIAAYEYAEVMDLWDRAVTRAKSEPKRPPLFIVLDQVTDPHNLGRRCVPQRRSELTGS